MSDDSYRLVPDKNGLLWCEDITQRLVMAELRNEGEAIETMLSCICAGVPRGNVQVQCFWELSQTSLDKIEYSYSWVILFNGESPVMRQSKLYIA